MISLIQHALEKRDSKNESSLQLTDSLPSEAIAYFLSQESKALNSPQLVVTSSEKESTDFISSLGFWGPHHNIVKLPSYNPTPYEGIDLPLKQVHQRMQWLFNALNNSNRSIFVASIQGLCQKTLPYETYFDGIIEYNIGDTLPDNFFASLHYKGYSSSPMVEDKGTFARRGGIFDIFPPHENNPLRIELFDNEIESIRVFDATTQRHVENKNSLTISPAREILLNESNTIDASETLLNFSSQEYHGLVDHLRRGEYCENLEHFLPLFYENLSSPLDFFDEKPQIWWVDQLKIENAAQSYSDFILQKVEKNPHPVAPSQWLTNFNDIRTSIFKSVAISKIQILDSVAQIDKTAMALTTQKMIHPNSSKKFDDQIALLRKIFSDNRTSNRFVFSIRGESQWQRVKPLIEDLKIPFSRLESSENFSPNTLPVGHLLIVDRYFKECLAFQSENLIALGYETFFGKTFQKRKKSNSPRGQHLSFGEIKENDFVVHALHGVCQFTGLTKMNIGGMEAEFLTLEFKGKDKLYLPIYRIHQIYKFAGDKSQPNIDKLGGSKWQNVKTKAKKRLREIANELIDLYAKRKESRRPAFQTQSPQIYDFFNAFAYTETPDQLSSIEDIIGDLSGPQPMDRLVCGDVGFGKTEVAMRAAFVVASQKKQVAILAPTTVLTMQHLQTFKKRFSESPLKIEVLNRLVSNAKVKTLLERLKNGDIDILIGTHRLLSKDIVFYDLGLLICDEEQRFGVIHKEKIKKLKYNIDNLALSATPIPRTLNMSLMGIRDLSIINTAPTNRLDTRTFICKYNEEIIRQAVETEVKRGGQVFYLHNRVQSIYSLADELRALLPKVRIGIAHGQLKETELESKMMAFFNHDIDLLLCTTIIESGMDIPNANTILIHKAENFGLSQLYQLRGRVGRSGRRAYCYLMTDRHKKLSDTAKERLKVIQENTALGSGLQIAQYDLELRGAGTLLGEEQSGVIDSVGYEFYMELLEESLLEAKGESSNETIEPEINLKISAYIPHKYIPNIKMRLSYYRALTQISDELDIDRFEEEMRDQFGKLPPEVLNLLGLMLIRHKCLELGVRDLASGRQNIVLSMTDQTPLPPEEVIKLAHLQNKKYTVTPDNRLKIRLNELSWPKVYDELILLLKRCPSG